jgi:hypothetical protein
MAGFQDFQLWEVRCVMLSAPFNLIMEKAHDCKRISWKYIGRPGFKLLFSVVSVPNLNSN